jgi:hypothetical protein
MSHRALRYVRRAIRWARLTFPFVAYFTSAGGRALEDARAEPPAHRKEAATAEDGTHEHEGERDAPSDGAAGDVYVAFVSTSTESMIVAHIVPGGTFRIIG